MKPPLSWSIAFRRVELFFKQFLTYRRCLCPFDSRIIGSAPWICYVCSNLRSMLRGRAPKRNAIITGGKRNNRRGETLAWFFPVKTREGWVYVPPHEMVAATYCIFKRRKIVEEIGRGFRFKPAFLTGLGVLGVLLVNDFSRRQELLMLYSPSLSSGLSSEFHVLPFVDLSGFRRGFLRRRIGHAHSVLKRLSCP